MNKKSTTVISGLTEATDDVLAKHSEFVSINMIRDVVIDLLGSTRSQMEAIRKDIKENKTIVTNHSNTIKQISNDINNLMQQSFTVTGIKN